MFWMIFALHVYDHILQVFQDMNYHTDEAEVSETHIKLFTWHYSINFF